MTVPGEPAGPLSEPWSAVSGQPDAPVIVLVHGSLDRSAGLLRLSRRLDDRYLVARYDRRGYGRSSGCGPPWTVEANIDDLERLVTEMRGGGHDPRPVVVFGHSFGGNVALGLAARRPDLVGAVVVYETPLSWTSWWPGNSAGAAAMAATGSDGAAEAFIRRLSGDEAWERLPEAKRVERRAEGAVMVAELADLRRGPPWHADEIGCPVLALVGEHARSHHRMAGSALATDLRDCRVETVPEAGHAGPHTHADGVAAAVSRFLADAAASGAITPVDG